MGALLCACHPFVFEVYPVTFFALALVLAAAFCHATWNFFVKRIGGGPELVWLFSAIAVVIYLPVAIYIFVTEQPVFGFWEIVFILGSAALHLGYFLLLQQGYRKGDLSLVYPTARATGPFLSTSFAVAFLGEHMTPQIAAGGGAVIVGVLCLIGGFKRDARHVWASLLFGFAAGLLIGSDVLQADGGTRTASITGAYVALRCAFERCVELGVLESVPLKDNVAAVSCGLYKGHAVLDLDYAEDSAAEADANFVLTGSGDIVEIQGTAEGDAFSQQQFLELMKLAGKGISELVVLQQSVFDKG